MLNGLTNENFQICPSLLSPKEQILQNVHIVQWRAFTILLMFLFKASPAQQSPSSHGTNPLVSPCKTNVWTVEKSNQIVSILFYLACTLVTSGIGGGGGSMVRETSLANCNLSKGKKSFHSFQMFFFSHSLWPFPPDVDWASGAMVALNHIFA